MGLVHLEPIGELPGLPLRHLARPAEKTALAGFDSGLTGRKGFVRGTTFPLRIFFCILFCNVAEKFVLEE